MDLLRNLAKQGVEKAAQSEPLKDNQAAAALARMLEDPQVAALLQIRDALVRIADALEARGV